MNPDEFMRRLEAGEELEPTDKNYKVYLHVENPLAGKIDCRASSSHPAPGYIVLDEATAGTVAWERPQDRDYYLGKHVKLGTWPATKQAKFYFQHLSWEQKQRFVDLYNEQKIKLAYPGHFYTRPFFMAPLEPS